MTGWWTARTTSREVLWSYSVRPDLWGPGLVVEYTTLYNVVMLAEWHWPDQLGQVTGWCAEAESLGLGDPGVAESLVLAGRVRLDTQGQAPADQWVPCPRPGGPA